ncbi:MAG TPA: alcohol dehydrogenase [Candidatus Saccharimonadales bacterium]|jgi:D-arabinose 1-dehydrogenase-like Zn-dependent alcohol dehydrogenase|nr:alcohol dehydrogenase [Candidatus Saccharimonadales bacterium]
MPKMRVFQVPKAKEPFQLVEREIPEPVAGSVRIKVQACGICHSDEYAKEGSRPGIMYPRVPGHEIAGVIDAIGSGVQGWEVGQRVGVGWHGGHCGYCNSCRRGDFVTCSKGRQITGLTCDGGYAEYMVISAAALAAIPDVISSTDAGPLLCAGVTTFNSLRNSGARPDDIVAILGLGGLGHLGVQFAASMGFETIAIARGKDKESFAKKLGAKHYLDSESQNVAAELEKLGGARVILSTVTSGKAVNSVLGGMGINGKTILVGNPDQPLEITGRLLIAGRRSICGWPSGSPIDSQDTLKYCALTGIRPMTEIYPLDRAPEAYERMLSGKARFRVVLATGL